MESDVDVFGPHMVLMVLSKRDHWLVIGKEGSGFGKIVE